MKELFQLFAAFFKIGGLTFGGGLAMLPMLNREVVDKHSWASKEELLDYYTIGQCTPGIIAVNTATFIGYKNKGVAGAIFATAGIVCPSVLIITVIALFLRSYADLPQVASAFKGIRAAVSGLIVISVARLAKTAVKDAAGVIIALAAFCVMLILDPSPVWVVLAAGVLGFFMPRKEGGA
ncbi:MAG: chromate transporter [Firmicutes bacterium]|nr:chromate transporter [Bacillota bacterium]